MVLQISEEVKFAIGEYQQVGFRGRKTKGRLFMKKSVTALAAVLAATMALTGCGSKTAEPVKEESSVAASESKVDAQESSGTQVEFDISEVFQSENNDDDNKPIYAHGKENIPALIATALTALGTKDEATYKRCCIDDIDLYYTYEQLRGLIYDAVEQSGGDPTKDLTCADFIVYNHSVNGSWADYFVYLKNCEKEVSLEIKAYTDDVDKQEYYLTVSPASFDPYEKVKEYAVSCPFPDTEYKLVDISQYKYKEVNGNE